MAEVKVSSWMDIADGFDLTENLYVVTDIHGCTKAFKRLLEHKPDNARLLFMGDAIDRGPDPMGTLRLIMGYPDAIILRGNHDGMAWFSQHGTDADEHDRRFMERAWSNNGGKQTRAIFQKAIADGEPAGNVVPEVPRIFEEYWLKAHNFWLSGNILFVHAGYPASKNDEWLEMDTLSASAEEDSPFWVREYKAKNFYTKPSRYKGKEVLVVSGHTPLDERYMIRPYGITLDRGYGRKMAAEFRPGRGMKAIVRFISTPCVEIKGPHDLWQFFDY